VAPLDPTTTHEAGRGIQNPLTAATGPRPDLGRLLSAPMAALIHLSATSSARKKKAQAGRRGEGATHGRRRTPPEGRGGERAGDGGAGVTERGHLRGTSARQLHQQHGRDRNNLPRGGCSVASESDQLVPARNAARLAGGSASTASAARWSTYADKPDELACASEFWTPTTAGHEGECSHGQRRAYVR